MKRDLNRLADQHFDVLIIGGGIHGGAIALEMARIGLKTALIEQKDFSHATSANSLKIIHGGLRYLQHLDFKRMRESIRSRREMMRIAPHLAKSLGCIVPTYGHGLKSKETMRAALFLNDLISWDRNHGLNADQHIPTGRVLLKEECLQLIPGLKENCPQGAALWYDALAHSTERLALSFILEATEYDACVANYIQATELIIRRDTVIGARAKNSMTNEAFDIQANTVVNAAGPWFEMVLGPAIMENMIPQEWSKAVNIIVKKKLFGEYAIGLEGTESYIDKEAMLKRGRRFFFFVPWRGYTMIGTTYKPHRAHSNRCKIEVEDVEELINEANSIYPSARLSFDDVTFFHAGIVPMAPSSNNNGSDVQLEKHSLVIDHERLHGLKGIISLRGVKYTTAPEVAKKVRNLIIRRKNLSIQKQAVDRQSTYTGDIPSEDNFCNNIIEPNGEFDIVQHLKSKYGRYYSKILQGDQGSKKLTSLISRHPPLTEAEVIHAIRGEMALKLSDIVFRRTELGTAECPSLQILQRVAEVAAKELGWDENQKSQEVREVLDCYYPLAIAEQKAL